MTAAAEDTRGGKTSPWVIGIIIGFILLALVNAGFIYIAVKGADQIVPSYTSEAR